MDSDSADVEKREKVRVRAEDPPADEDWLRYSPPPSPVRAEEVIFSKEKTLSRFASEIDGEVMPVTAPNEDSQKPLGSGFPRTKGGHEGSHNRYTNSRSMEGSDNSMSSQDTHNTMTQNIGAPEQKALWKPSKTHQHQPSSLLPSSHCRRQQPSQITHRHTPYQSSFSHVFVTWDYWVVFDFCLTR
ncbi:hypothetical protein KIW84_043272 [Lathyrus oleraceus]|uniref:Uncharacterized protein n=1 Tax=Pisum sativum TaxID=3888 RepID=A0A9D4XDC9_PEA|nr:hypothetical protein KIW84_043272 [Pisum sativum]